MENVSLRLVESRIDAGNLSRHSNATQASRSDQQMAEREAGREHGGIDLRSLSKAYSIAARGSGRTAEREPVSSATLSGDK